ncbi:MAG: ABC transporter ATP-binding protein [Anaerolineales bacterium]|nr:ABC transporter ATP-binding protein [Anaerolineales bacterium]
MSGIWKYFPGIVANKNVDLELRNGEVHALLGENGAGKTTLMKILSGLYRPDKGTIQLGGENVHLNSPNQAIAAGIGMVHQHFCLVEKLTVAENLHLGWSETPKLISKGKLAERSQAISTKYGLHIEPLAKIWQISVGEQQRVEILRVLTRGARVLILDEPTAVLTPSEAKELFQIMRTLAKNGHALVFISHKLNEVLEVSDRVTILRGGKKVHTCSTSECSQRSLARLMIGDDMALQVPEKSKNKTKVILNLKDANARNDRGLPALREVNLSIKAGEILGVAGVAGNGQKELAQVLTGLRKLEQGSIIFRDKDITNKSPRTFARAGIGHIPEDRCGTGLVMNENVVNNAILREYGSFPICRGLRLDHRAGVKVAKEIVREGAVQLPSINITVRHLSGGNQQRLVLQREMRTGLFMLVTVHPTRGLDVGAIDAVQRALIRHRNNGCGILLISEDLDELFTLSDRIIVMYECRIVGEFEAACFERDKVGLLMGGHFDKNNSNDEKTND